MLVCIIDTAHAHPKKKTTDDSRQVVSGGKSTTLCDVMKHRNKMMIVVVVIGHQENYSASGIHLVRARVIIRSHFPIYPTASSRHAPCDLFSGQRRAARLKR